MESKKRGHTRVRRIVKSDSCEDTSPGEEKDHSTKQSTEPNKDLQTNVRKGRGKKKTIFLGKSPKLWVGGVQES